MALVDLNKGGLLSKKEIKARTLAVTGWTTEQYNKEYDKLRNRVRNYERATGKQRGTYAVNELLYKEQAAKKKYGGEYRPSALLRDIRESTSYSTGEKYAEKAKRVAIPRAFQGLKRSFAGAASKSKAVAEMLSKAEKQLKAGEKVDIKGLTSALEMEIKSAQAYNRAQEKAQGLPRGSYKGGYDKGSKYKQ